MDVFVPRRSPRAAGVRQVSTLALGAFKLRFSGKKERKKGQQRGSAVVSSQESLSRQRNLRLCRGFFVEMDKCQVPKIWTEIFYPKSHEVMSRAEPGMLCL